MAPTQHDLPPHPATGKDDTPVVVVTVLMTFIATVFIGLRLYGCLLILRRRLYLEEWLSVINQVRWDQTRDGLANPFDGTFYMSHETANCIVFRSICG